MKSLLFICLTVIICFSIAMFSSSCKTFEPVVIEGEPQECNDLYTFVSLSTKMSGIIKKDNNAANTALTLVSITYSKCLEARKDQKKQIRFDKCVKIVYGKELKPKAENYKMYADFVDCLNF